VAQTHGNVRIVTQNGIEIMVAHLEVVLLPLPVKLLVVQHLAQPIHALVYVEQEQTAVCGETILHLVQIHALEEHATPVLAAILITM